MTTAISMYRSSCGHRENVFRLTAFEAAIGGVQNLLVTPAFFARDGKLHFVLNCGGEGFYLSCVRGLVAYALGFNGLSAALQFQLNRLFHAEGIVGAQDASLAHQFERSAVLGAERDTDGR